MQQRSISVLIKGRRIKMRPTERLEVEELRIGVLTQVMVMKCFNYVMLYLSLLYLSSPYLCVFSDSCNLLHGSRY